jgi:hypothetical protein
VVSLLLLDNDINPATNSQKASGPDLGIQKMNWMPDQVRHDGNCKAIEETLHQLLPTEVVRGARIGGK